MSEIIYDGPGELDITRIREAQEWNKDSFDRVITVCQDSVEDNVSDDMEYSYYCMSDGQASYGGDSSYELFREAADELHDALESGEKVLIHCHAGQSRSVAVSMAALALLLDIQRTEAYDIINTYRPQANPNMDLVDHVKMYLIEREDHEEYYYEDL